MKMPDPFYIIVWLFFGVMAMIALCMMVLL